MFQFQLQNATSTFRLPNIFAFGMQGSINYCIDPTVKVRILKHVKGDLEW